MHVYIFKFSCIIINIKLAAILVSRIRMVRHQHQRVDGVASRPLAEVAKYGGGALALIGIFVITSSYLGGTTPPATVVVGMGNAELDAAGSAGGTG